LEPEELEGVLDDAEAFYNEHYADEAQFNRVVFQKMWEQYLMFGQGLFFIESQDGVDRSTFACVRTTNTFTGQLEYHGSFIAVKPEFRGKDVVKALMDSVVEFLKKIQMPFRLIVHSHVPTVQGVFLKLGFAADAVRYHRRVDYE